MVVNDHITITVIHAEHGTGWVMGIDAEQWAGLFYYTATDWCYVFKCSPVGI